MSLTFNVVTCYQYINAGKTVPLYLGACFTDDVMCTTGTNAIHGGVDNTTRAIITLMMDECCSSSNNGLSYRDENDICRRCPSM